MSDTTAAIVEYMDPDWRDHFREVDEAFEFYQLHSHGEFCRAYYEVTGDEWHDNE